MWMIGLVDMVELGQRLEWTVLEVLSKLNDFVIVLCELQKLRVAHTTWSCSE